MYAPASVPCDPNSAHGNIDGVDRLSALPDDLLHHVMSFLPMPEVVRTSLLSPRWRCLWASTPFIRIGRQDFNAGNDPGCKDEHKLEKFAENLLLLRDVTVSLDEALISITSYADSRKSSEWIHHAIKHKVRLHISGFYQPLTKMFPSQHLRRIKLQHVCFYDSSVEPLNHDCPVLEHLELDCCVLFISGISSGSLKVLRITHCIIGSDLLISARNLTHLSVIDPQHYRAILILDLPSLASALISLRAPGFHYQNEPEVGHRLLDVLSHAQTLELYAPLPELAFEKGLQACPIFSNLTRLVLGDWCMAADFYPLFRILHGAPKLEELTVKLEMEHCETCKEAESTKLTWRRAPPIRGYSPVEQIKIHCNKDDPRIGALVQALLPIFIPDGKISIEGRVAGSFPLRPRKNEI